MDSWKQEGKEQGAWEVEEQKWSRNVANENKTAPNLVKKFFVYFEREWWEYTLLPCCSHRRCPRKPPHGQVLEMWSRLTQLPCPIPRTPWYTHWGTFCAQLLIAQRKKFPKPLLCKSLKWSQSSTLHISMLISNTERDLCGFYLKLFSYLSTYENNPFKYHSGSRYMQQLEYVQQELQKSPHATPRIGHISNTAHTEKLRDILSPSPSQGQTAVRPRCHSDLGQCPTSAQFLSVMLKPRARSSEGRILPNKPFWHAIK